MTLDSRKCFFLKEVVFYNVFLVNFQSVRLRRLQKNKTIFWFHYKKGSRSRITGVLTCMLGVLMHVFSKGSMLLIHPNS
jgi:hypothetical protein